jgi:hypothetical protein
MEGGEILQGFPSYKSRYPEDLRSCAIRSRVGATLYNEVAPAAGPAHVREQDQPAPRKDKKEDWKCSATTLKESQIMTHSRMRLGIYPRPQRPHKS